MKNWKTTMSGLAVGICTLIVMNPDAFTDPNWLTAKPLPVRLASWILAGGLASLGISAKDC